MAVASSRYVAEDALDAIEVRYEALPAVVRMPDALRDDVVLHEEQGTNLAAQYTVSVGDIDAAWQAAAYTRKATFAVHRHTGNPLETRGLVASYHAGRGELSVWGPPRYRISTVLSWLLCLTCRSIRSTSSSPMLAVVLASAGSFIQRIF